MRPSIPSDSSARILEVVEVPDGLARVRARSPQDDVLAVPDARNVVDRQVQVVLSLDERALRRVLLEILVAVEEADDVDAAVEEVQRGGRDDGVGGGCGPAGEHDAHATDGEWTHEQTALLQRGRTVGQHGSVPPTAS
jgi:hypothetical protein